MRQHLLVVVVISGLAAGAAGAQGEAPSFCATAGAYMYEIAVRRDAGSSKEDAVREVAPEFDAFATSQADLAMRRRVLAESGPLATFAFDLEGAQPATVQQIGEGYCSARGGHLDLAPSTTSSRQMAAAARECEADGSSRGCIARAVDARALREVNEPSSDARSTSKVQPFYEFALSYGGDTVGTIQFVSGGQQDIDTGNGITAGGGIIQRINDSFGIKYSAGYKLSFSAASNVDVVKSVVPLEILPYYKRGDHRFGAGLSHHLSPQVDWDWLAPTTKFEDATGVTLEYAWKRLSFSYTDIDYESGGTTLDAGHLTVKYTSRH